MRVHGQRWATSRTRSALSSSPGMFTSVNSRSTRHPLDLGQRPVAIYRAGHLETFVHEEVGRLHARQRLVLNDDGKRCAPAEGDY